MLRFLTIWALFVVLLPGVLFTIPMSGAKSKVICALVHGVIFAVLLHLFKVRDGFQSPTLRGQQDYTANTLLTPNISACIAEPGKYCKPVLTTCPAGYRCAGGEGATSATAVICESGTFCPEGASESTTCPVGSYCPLGVGRPIACPAGGYCPAGAARVTVCPVGSYCLLGTATPTACPQGKTTSGTKSKSLADCKTL
jgi:hypothetical protein